MTDEWKSESYSPRKTAKKVAATRRNRTMVFNMGGTPDVRWRQRFQSFQKAFAQLDAAARLAEQRPLSELEQQGFIQAFEFTHELAWNTFSAIPIQPRAFQRSDRSRSRGAHRPCGHGGLRAGGPDGERRREVKVEAEPDRYLFIDADTVARDDFRAMEDFVIGLPEGEARRDLKRTLRRAKPFRNFREALRD